MLSRSSGEVKFDGSSCMLKPVYFAFVKTMLQFFANYTFFEITSTFAKTDGKNNRAMALRRTILMKADPVVSLHALRCSAVTHAHAEKTPVVV